MENKKLILGLDVSTKTIGISLFEESGKLRFLKHVSPVIKPKPTNGIESLIKKVEMFELDFLSEYVDWNIGKVIIEEPLLRSNNVVTAGLLLKFNGMISKSIYDILGVVPDFISSYDARAFGFPELMAVRTHKKNGEPYSKAVLAKKDPTLFGAYPTDVDKKSIIWEKVMHQEPQVTWPLNRKGLLAKEAYDMSDAYVCVTGFMRKEGFWE